MKLLCVVFLIFTLLGLGSVMAASSSPAPASRNGNYEERLFESKLDILRARMDGTDEALKIKAAEMERRLEGLNELRKDVVKDRDQFVRKDLNESKVKMIDELNNRVTIIETRLFVWMSAMAVFFVILQVIVHFWMDSKKSASISPKFSEEDLARIRDAWMKVK